MQTRLRLQPARLPGTVLFLCIAGLLLLAGCGSEPAAETVVVTTDPAPVGSTAEAPAGSQDVSAAGLNFTLPEGWDREQPSSNMRAAQAAVNGSGGAGQLTVFFFGPGGGGSVDANLSRWVGQMEAADAAPTRDQFETADFLVTTIRQAGTLKASTMGTFPSTDQPNYALLGAVVEGPGGPWFFKAVGPQATMDEQAAAFRQMLEGVTS